LTFGETDSCL
jgi:hypothetical protein